METSVLLIIRGIARLLVMFTLLFLFIFIICKDLGDVGCMGLEFNFMDMKSSNRPSQIKVFNDSYFTNNALSLTKDSTDQAQHQPSVGRVFYMDPIPLWTNASGTLCVASFNTSFHFRIKNSTAINLSGDGMAFLMSGNLLPAPPNSSGNGLGILDRSLDRQYSSANRIVAIEFDTFRDTHEYGDINDNHAGIDMNSLNSTHSRSLDKLGIQLKNGTELMAWVDYTADSSLLSVYVATYQLPFTKPGTAFISYPVNLSDYLPEEIYIGFSAATSKYLEIHEIFLWQFVSTALTMNCKLSGGAIAGIVLASLFFVSLLAIILCRFRTMRQKKKIAMKMKREWTMRNAELAECAGPRRFSYKEIMTATKYFSEENYLGRGGFGPVYKGILPKEHTPIAVKSIGENSKQGEREFLAEVTIISRVRHRNLLQLQGWCHEKGQLFLVYEYMPNRSLDQHLFKEPGQGNRNNPLNWNDRYRIVCGLAAGLLYLHEEWEKQVIHRDVKAANVMLDCDMNAHLGDFGLARLVDHNHMLQTTTPAGTLGYLPPEVAETGKATSASDVYSFGAVALEVACGRRILDYNALRSSEVRLVGWVWDLYSQGLLLQAADPRLEADFEHEEMERMLCMGLACSHPMPNSRPTMREVCDCLLNKSPHPPISTSRLELVYSSARLFETPPQSISQVIGGTSSSLMSTAALSSSSSQSSCLLPR